MINSSIQIEEEEERDAIRHSKTLEDPRVDRTKLYPLMGPIQVRLFPNDQSAWQLIGALLAEQNDRWQFRRSLNMDEVFG